jgi:hypothetical protein
MNTEDVRLTVYDSFARTGRAPTVDALAARFEVAPDAIGAALVELALNRHVALDATGEIAMAHPFSAVPLGFSVMGPQTLWWGGCAWDAFAVPHLLQIHDGVLVATTCPSCGRPLAWSVGTAAPPAGDEVAHFLVPTARMWDDVVRTCGNQRLYCGAACVDAWLTTTGHTRGAVLDLTQLWRLASHWYDGRLERGYVRREPAAAHEYLRAAGLKGTFWGLSD